jgi:hypothetical protein
VPEPSVEALEKVGDAALGGSMKGSSSGAEWARLDVVGGWPKHDCGARPEQNAAGESGARESTQCHQRAFLGLVVSSSSWSSAAMAVVSGEVGALLAREGVATGTGQLSLSPAKPHSRRREGPPVFGSGGSAGVRGLQMRRST